MSDYRRYFVPGGTFFFALVMERRARVFSDTGPRRILGSVLRRCSMRYPFEVVAIVLLPEHLHAIWTLPPGDAAYARRWGWIKKEFTKGWLGCGGVEQPQSEGRRLEGRRGVWQRRYWEHTIDDEDDLEAHFDYIHYNPVKHGWARAPRDWPWSSFHRWVQAGHYSSNWAAGPASHDVPDNAGE